MGKQNLDMAKFTRRQRFKAASLEEGLKKEGVAPRQAEEQAWKEASETGRGKRRKDHSYGGRAKINSSATPNSRKTHVGGSEANSRERSGRGIGKVSGKER